ncbi:hypothetical protein ACLOJK_035862 [Asimina triloba]
MSLIPQLLGLCFWLPVFLPSYNAVLCQAAAVRNVTAVVAEGTVTINGSVAIAKTDKDFICATLDWWPPEKCDYGTCSWDLASLLNLDLSNTVLLNAIKAFSPLKIRLGGTLQDKVIYDTGGITQPCKSFVRNSSEMFGFTQGCLPMSRWDQLNEFFKKADVTVIFGLNALNGRKPMPDGSVGGPWDYSNAAALMQYTVNKGYTIHGWELGNELSGSGVGTRIAAAQYAADVISLYTLVQNIYGAYKDKPLVLAPGGFYDANWFKDLIGRTVPNKVDVITHHIYNLGPGVDEHLVEKILNPDYLDGEASTFSGLQNILKNSPTSATAWVGEAGGAYNSGHHLVTDSFVFSFWYLDQLGMSSTYDTKTYCRQSLVGGNYGLLNRTTFQPNPDYYSALLWHRLMGRNVLSTSFSGNKKLPMPKASLGGSDYKQTGSTEVPFRRFQSDANVNLMQQGIALLLMNLDRNTTVRVHVSTQADVSKFLKHRRHRRTRFSRMQGTLKPGSSMTREEYHLTPKDGDLHSQTMLLNGKLLAVDSNGEIPPLESVALDNTEPVNVAPLAIVFVHIPNVSLPACT